MAVQFPVKGKESLDKAPEPENLPAGVGSNSVVLLITLTMAHDRLFGFVPVDISAGGSFGRMLGARNILPRSEMWQMGLRT